MLVTLVVNPRVATREEFLHLVVGSLEVIATARLVTERPEYHARMVAISQHHALCAVHVGCAPGRVVGE